jgi:hypothetical protein
MRHILFILLFSTAAHAETWSIQIKKLVEPGKYVKDYPLTDKAYIPYITGTAWKCQVSETYKEKEKSVFYKLLSCTYGRTIISAKTNLACVDGGGPQSSSLLIGHEGGNSSHSLILSCNL